jgi:glycosyltransferase involved in cell wall biosynthesis
MELPGRALSGARIAVVHEWLLDYAGSERVLAEILATFPDADLFALVDRPEADLRAALGRRAKATSFIQHLPKPRRWLRYYLPLMPLAVEQLDVSGYDIVISSSHAVAKGVITGPDQLHVSYVHSPMRYAWDLQHEYLRQSGLHRGLPSCAARMALHRLRQWDARSANGVDSFLANSRHVARRIRKAYRREAEVLHPPVNVAGFLLEEQKEDYYVTVSRLEPYKRVDLLVEAFARLPDRRLVVIGDGPQRKRLAANAPGNVELLGYRPAGEVHERMRKARAFLFAGIEDFGIALAEAQACGTPVIAYGRGGATEIVRAMGTERPTGWLFHAQTPEAIVDAVRGFEREAARFAPSACRENAERFAPERFRAALAAHVATLWRAFSRELSTPASSR